MEKTEIFEGTIRELTELAVSKRKENLEDSEQQPAPGGCRTAGVRQRQAVAGFAPQQESHALQAHEN